MGVLFRCTWIALLAIICCAVAASSAPVWETPPALPADQGVRAENAWSLGEIYDSYRRMQGRHEAAPERWAEDALRASYPDRVVRYGTLLGLHLRDGSWARLVDTLPPPGSPAGGEAFSAVGYEPGRGYTVAVERGGEVRLILVPDDGQSIAAEGRQPVRIGALDERWYAHQGVHPEGADRDEERRLRDEMPGMVARYGTMLALRLADGRQALMADILPAPDFLGGFGTVEVHSLVAYLRLTDHFVVQVNHGEGDWHLLVSRRTGELTVFDGEPLLEPTTELVLLGFRESGMGSHALDVWEFREGAWREVFRCQTLADGFLPTQARWVSPHQVLVSNFFEEGQFAGGAVLERVDGVWRSAACTDAGG